MTSIHAKHSERKNIEGKIKDFETKLKQLRKDLKTNTLVLYDLMVKAELEEYQDLKIEKLKPKEKLKPLTKKKKTVALVKHLGKLGIQNPEKFVEELRTVEKNARFTED